MVRQARSYLAGAISSAGLIAACVAVFVGLVALGASGKLPVLNSVGDEPAARQGAESTGPTTPAGVGGGTAAPSSGAPSGASSTASRAANAGEASPERLTGSAGGGAAGGGSPPVPSGPGEPAATTPAGGSPSLPNRSSSRTRAPVSPPAQPVGGLPSSQDVADTVNGTVDQVDEALGNPLERSGVGGVVKGATQGLAGPDSTLGKTVDGLAGALGGER